MEYIWKITGMKKIDTLDEMPNVIVHVTWHLTAIDTDGTRALYEGATPLEPPPADSFVTYDDLTEEIVLGWIQVKVTGTYGEHVYGLLNSRLEKQRQTSQQVNDFEWAKPTPLQGYN
jgi:hypothetical protein